MNSLFSLQIFSTELYLYIADKYRHIVVVVISYITVFLRVAVFGCLGIVDINV